MKIEPVHYTFVYSKVRPILADNPELVEIYERGQFVSADKTKDLQRRFCFDLLSAASISAWVSDNLYPYLNDDHIYAALKKMLPTLERKY